MRRAGHATRSRLLAAARREFAEHGPAGARINRIAAEAHASKDRLYAYFPSKEELFGEVIRQWLLELEAAAQPSPDDMPGYVGRLFDHFVEHPRDGRLAAWAQLEAEQHLLGPDFDILGSAVEAVREGQRGGTVDRAWAPRDLVLLLIGIDMLEAKRSPTQETGGEAEEASAKEDAGIVPLGIPMLAGPGAISSVMVLVGQSPSVWQMAAILSSIALTALISYWVLASAGTVKRVLGDTGIRILVRIMGLLLVALAMQFFVNGLTDLGLFEKLPRAEG
jgi:AcrR family transcriptional regulator